MQEKENAFISVFLRRKISVQGTLVQAGLQLIPLDNSCKALKTESVWAFKKKKKIQITAPAHVQRNMSKKLYFVNAVAN